MIRWFSTEYLVKSRPFFEATLVRVISASPSRLAAADNYEELRTIGHIVPSLFGYFKAVALDAPLWRRYRWFRESNRAVDYITDLSYEVQRDKREKKALTPFAESVQ